MTHGIESSLTLNISPADPEKTAKIKRDLSSQFGIDAFTLPTMKKWLSAAVYDSIESTILRGGKLHGPYIGEIAEAMKNWAISRGATHFSHWFQPLSGFTAEKHDAFLHWDEWGQLLFSFGAKDLLQSEPDASSFPSGGLRATATARGYTGWDPTSTPFIKRNGSAATICIPSFYIGYHGEALDRKTPLLRSQEALSHQICRLAEWFGIDAKGRRAHCCVGCEQEYFLIDKEHYLKRMDLIQTGRTLFGKLSAKHQQFEDHYFGAIKPRIIAYMTELDHALWSLGIPVKTRHNEVAPAQYELAPYYGHLNIGIDQNMIAMEVMRQLADKHRLVCLHHEKPFAGVNGSGKHCNWSVVGPDGKNWLHPGATPHENLKFLILLCAIIRAIDTHADLLRASIATAGNDHRLGANEAPPAIISIHLGDQLSDILTQIENGMPHSARRESALHIGIESMPTLERDGCDRNRTSPFAFIGNKFEFRAVGSNQNPSLPTMVLNTIVADSVAEVCDQLDARKGSNSDLNGSLIEIIRGIIAEHKRVIFNGDNYSEEWQREAGRLGLLNLQRTPEALAVLEEKKNRALFSKHAVLKERELASRYEVARHTYQKSIALEAECSLHMARTMLIPAALHYLKELRSFCSEAQKKLYNTVSKLVDDALNSCELLEGEIAAGELTKVRGEMARLRQAIDALEGYVPEKLWPLPSYAQMLLLNH